MQLIQELDETIPLKKTGAEKFHSSLHVFIEQETESGATGAGLSGMQKTSPLKFPTLTCTLTRQGSNCAPCFAQRHLDESGEGKKQWVLKRHLISSQRRHPRCLFLPTDAGGNEEARWELWHGASHDVHDRPVGLRFSSDSESKVEIERGAVCPACVKDYKCITTHRNWAAECNLTKTTVNVSDICSYRTSILFHYYHPSQKQPAVVS